MTNARTITIEEQGAPSVMRLVSGPLPAPGEGEATIRQTAIGINFMDVYQRSGHYPLELPSGIGLEAAGVVEAIGAGVTDLDLGDRVAYSGGPPGSYADYRNVPAGRIVKVPVGVSDEQAAAILLKGTTAEYLLERAYPVKAGENVLFYAAAGGVGSIAGQWGKALGARMIGIAGGPEKCALARAHGYDEVIDRNNEDVVARVRELTGGAGVPVLYDSVGKDTYEQSIDCLAPRGYFVSFGTTSGKVPPVDAATLQHKGSLYFTRPTLANYCAARGDFEASVARVFDMVASGAVKIDIGQRYDLADAVQAHSDLEGGRTTGSSILIP
jgi:NADPH2:quinone reductase